MLGCTLLIGIIPPFALSVVFVMALALLWSPMSTHGLLLPMMQPFLIVAAGLGAMMLGNIALQAGMTRAGMAQAEGEKVSLRACLGAAFRRILPLALLSILIILASIASMVLLFIPAVVLAVLLSVAAPAIVAENLGALAAVRRSIALTSGQRWRIFGLLAIVMVIYWAFWTVVSIILAIMGWVVGPKMTENAVGVLLVVAVWISWIGGMAYWGALAASLYLELRTIKEGPMTNSLAEVFA